MFCQASAGRIVEHVLAGTRADADVDVAVSRIRAEEGSALD